MNHFSWGQVIQWAIWGLLMSLTMRWLAKGRRKQRPPAESRILLLPVGILVVGLVCSMVFIGALVLSNVYGNRTTTWWTTAIFAAFALLGLYLVASYFLERHEVSDEGLAFGRVFGKRLYLRWKEVRHVQYSKNMQWFRVETDKGDVARVSAMLMGLPEFAKLALANVPRKAVELRTLPVLQATADNRLPGVAGV